MEKEKMIKTFYEFANALGERESSNNYKIVNIFEYAGRWQFGKLLETD